MTDLQKLSVLKNMLISSGLDCKIQYINGTGKPEPSIYVNHDYCGMYPDNEVYHKISIIDSIVSRRSDLEVIRHHSKISTRIKLMQPLEKQFPHDIKNYKSND